jgi:spore maturation protein CgeB
MLIAKSKLERESTASALTGARLALLGAAGGTHIGGSLARSAAKLGIRSIWFDADKASDGSRLLRSLSWHFADGRPIHLDRFSKQIVESCAPGNPEVLIATGMAPLTEPALHELRRLGVVCVNYSTDDPWNPAMRSRWHLRALPSYDLIFTPRRSNLDDFRRLGCTNVHYLPFGYDESLYTRSGYSDSTPVHEILFVGGADPDRVAFVSEFMRYGPPVALAGGYWERYPALRPFALGTRSPEVIRALTAAAKVNLCLVRRANRDGHVMRSFEIAAAGGCMLAEDTQEHREIFGPEGDAVVYFRNPQDAAQRARALLSDSSERERLATCLHRRILSGAHTYTHRLVTMFKIGNDQRNKAVGM